MAGVCFKFTLMHPVGVFDGFHAGVDPDFLHDHAPCRALCLAVVEVGRLADALRKAGVFEKFGRLA